MDTKVRSPLTSKQKQPSPFLVFHLRILVLALGESAVPAWWKTGFMNETGLRFLERLYPRTSFHAAVLAAGKSASGVHDQAVGRVGVYHLFRLPDSLETDIHRMLSDLDGDFFSVIRNALGRPEELMKLLALLCDRDGVNVGAGAKRIGTDKDLTTPAGFEKTAAAYRQAFALGKPCFPYFTIEQTGSLR